MYFVVQVENAEAASSKALAAWLAGVQPDVEQMSNVLYAEIAPDGSQDGITLERATAAIENIRTLQIIGRTPVDDEWDPVIAAANLGTIQVDSSWDDTVPMAWQRVASTTNLSAL